MQFVDDMILGAAIGFSERNGSGPAGGGQTVRRLSRTSQQDKKGSDAIGAPDLAEKEGFEPSDGFTHHTISSRESHNTCMPYHVPNSRISQAKRLTAIMASSNALGSIWAAYKSAVSWYVECPKIVCKTFIGTPSAAIIVAHVWRKPCIVIRGKPAA